MPLASWRECGKRQRDGEELKEQREKKEEERKRYLSDANYASGQLADKLLARGNETGVGPAVAWGQRDTAQEPSGTPKRWADPTATSQSNSPGAFSMVNARRSVAQMARAWVRLEPAHVPLRRGHASPALRSPRWSPRCWGTGRSLRTHPAIMSVGKRGEPWRKSQTTNAIRLRP